MVVRFHRTILLFGFTMVEEDHCVYLKQSTKKVLIMTFYINEILMASNDVEMIIATKDWLLLNFD